MASPTEDFIKSIQCETIASVFRQYVTNRLHPNKSIETKETNIAVLRTIEILKIIKIEVKIQDGHARNYSKKSNS